MWFSVENVHSRVEEITRNVIQIVKWCTYIRNVYGDWMKWGGE